MFLSVRNRIHHHIPMPKTRLFRRCPASCSAPCVCAWVPPLLPPRRDSSRSARARRVWAEPSWLSPTTPPRPTGTRRALASIPIFDLTLGFGRMEQEESDEDRPAEGRPRGSRTRSTGFGVALPVLGVSYYGLRTGLCSAGHYRTGGYRPTRCEYRVCRGGLLLPGAWASRWRSPSAMRSWWAARCGWCGVRLGVSTRRGRRGERGAG